MMARPMQSIIEAVKSVIFRKQRAEAAEYAAWAVEWAAQWERWLLAHEELHRYMDELDACRTSRPPHSAISKTMTTASPSTATALTATGRLA